MIEGTSLPALPPHRKKHLPRSPTLSLRRRPAVDTPGEGRDETYGLIQRFSSTEQRHTAVSGVSLVCRGVAQI